MNAFISLIRIYLLHKKHKETNTQEEEEQWGNVYAHVLFQDILGHHTKL
jgi:hypothetical protein